MSAVQTLGLSTPCWAFPTSSAPPTSPSLSLDQPRNQGPGLAPSTPSCMYPPTLNHHLPRSWPAGCSWSLLQWPTAPPSLLLSPPLHCSAALAEGLLGFQSHGIIPPPRSILQRLMGAAGHPRPCLSCLAAPVHLLTPPSSPASEPGVLLLIP